MREKIGRFLQHIGYINAVTTLPEFSIYFLPENGNAEVVMTIDYQKEIYLSEEAYNGIRERFIQSFKEKGFANVHIITIVLCKNLDRMEVVFGKDAFCWYLHTDENRLYIPERHVEDFYGLKKKVEEFLHNLMQYNIEVEFEDSTLKKDYKVKRAFKELPFVNVTIVLINILIFILCAFTQDVLYNKGAFSILLIEETKEYYRFLTSIFLHVDIDHLFSNMIVLYFLGNGLEQKIGHIKYVLLYFLSAISGDIVSAIYEIHIGNMFTSVGASGAIFGVIGAVLVLVVTSGGKWENITLPRMLIMVIYSLYSGFMAEDVNNAAHIGGFIAGLLIMGMFSIINRLRKKKEVLHEN